VFVKLNQEVGSYTIRIANDLIGQVLGGFAAMPFNGIADDPSSPKPLMNYAGKPLVDNLQQRMAGLEISSVTRLAHGCFAAISRRI
jgi:hypothetical protein